MFVKEHISPWKNRTHRLAQIAYLLLCHKNAPRVIEQARILTSQGDTVVIHADTNAGSGFRNQIATALADNPKAVLAASVKCGWGEWSLVAATLNMVRMARAKFPETSHYFLMSGDCMPTKPAHFIHSELDASDTDMIEHADFFSDNWIKTGLHADRVHYRHWFNERSQKSLFYGSLNMQRRLGLSRDVPKGIRMRIGSQWWVLRKKTIDLILNFIGERPDVLRFFKTTWIPDETFFQTLTMHLLPREEVVSLPPTYLMFSDYGMPVTFCADHYDLLRTQDRFFARKISDHDDNLRERLGALFMSDEDAPETVDTGRALYDYLRRRGREGRRFGQRAWVEGGQLGRNKRITIVLCKKWHLAKRVSDGLRHHGGQAAFGFIFDEDDAGLPDLGNLQAGLDKRNRHRRAFLNVLMKQTDASVLTFCCDPSNLGLLRDLASDGCALTLLELATDVDDAWLEGHASRIGLGSRSEAGGLHAGLMTTLRRNIADESTAIRDLSLPGHRVVHTSDTPGAMARPMADVFGVSVDVAGRIAQHARLSED